MHIYSQSRCNVAPSEKNLHKSLQHLEQPKVDDENRQIRPESEHSQVRHGSYWGSVQQTDSRYGCIKVHPKLRCGGAYPIDFPFAFRAEQFEAMDKEISLVPKGFVLAAS